MSKFEVKATPNRARHQTTITIDERDDAKIMKYCWGLRAGIFVDTKERQPRTFDPTAGTLGNCAMRAIMYQDQREILHIQYIVYICRA
jgi:hypothetical protein